MTERQWLVWRDPEAMLKLVRMGCSDRKLRLFALAALRGIPGSYIHHHAFKAPLRAIERYAEGEVSANDLERAREAANESLREIDAKAGELEWYYLSATRYVAAAVVLACGHHLTQNIDHLPILCADALGIAAIPGQSSAVRLQESERQAHLIREIFGNPFRPGILETNWRTSTAVAIAKEMYESRDFSAMPILADALQDAGCESPDILNHCRGRGPHVRGCWVVDLVLGRS